MGKFNIERLNYNGRVADKKLQFLLHYSLNSVVVYLVSVAMHFTLAQGYTCVSAYGVMEVFRDTSY